MRFITAPEIEIALDQKSLIEALRRAFRMGASARPYQAPLRNRFYVENVHADPTILLNMPSWQVDGDLGIKMVTVNTGNPAKGLPMVQGVYLFLDAGTGKVRGILATAMRDPGKEMGSNGLDSDIYVLRSPEDPAQLCHLELVSADAPKPNVNIIFSAISLQNLMR